MSAASVVEDPASARGEVRPEGLIRARAVVATCDNRIRDALERAARSARRRANAKEADARRFTHRNRSKEAVA